MICKNCGKPIRRMGGDSPTLYHIETELVWCDPEAFRALLRAT